MIIFGNQLNINEVLSRHFIIRNLSSYLMSYQRDVKNIIPPALFDYLDKDFDIQYANYLLSDMVFYEFFGNIIFPSICEGKDMYILVHRDNEGPFDMLTESIQKFIQQRYGINSYLVNSYEDIDELLTDYDKSDIIREPIHIENLDNDLQRYLNYGIQQCPYLM